MLYTVILWVVFALAGGALAFIGWVKAINWLADQDKWWSPVRKKPGDGQFVYLTRGVKPGGPYAGIIESIKRWKYENDRFVEDEDSTSQDGSYLSDKLGIVWVEFFRQVYSRERVYETISEDKKIVRKEMKGGEDKNRVYQKSSVFYFQTNLATEVLGIELAEEKISIDIIVSYIMRLIDPNLAEFVTGKPEIVIDEAIKALLRAYASGKTYSDLLKESGNSKDSGFAQFLGIDNVSMLNEESRDKLGLIERHGIAIFSPYIVEINLSKESADFANAVQQTAIKEEERKANEKEAASIRLIGSARANAARELVEAYGASPAGPAIAIASAVKDNTKATTLVLGSAPVAISPTPNP